MRLLMWCALVLGAVADTAWEDMYDEWVTDLERGWTIEQVETGDQRCHCKAAPTGLSPRTTTSTPATTSPTLPPTTPATSGPTTTIGTPETTPCLVTRYFCEGCGVANINVPDFRIVGGQNASPGEYPFQVLVQPMIANSVYICGGTIIKRRWILTAAHCFFDSNNTRYSAVKVFAGSILWSQGTELDVKDVIIHESFNSITNGSDIALIELTHDLHYEDDINIQPICLGEESDIPFNGKAVAVGWGDLQFGNNHGSFILQEVALDVITTPDCAEKILLPPDSSTTLCTLTSSKDTCQGDSGGPLLTQLCDGRWAQVGITSYGINCTVPDSPAVYTRVSSYFDWIEAKTASSPC